MATATPRSSLPTNPTEDIDSIANLLRTFLPDHEAISLTRSQNTEQLIQHVRSSIDDKPGTRPEPQVFGSGNVHYDPANRRSDPHVPLGVGPSSSSQLSQGIPQPDDTEKKKDPDWDPEYEDRGDDSDSDATIDMPLNSESLTKNFTKSGRDIVLTPEICPKNYPCFICDDVIAELGDYKAHMRRHIKQIGMIQCPNCHESFESRRQLNAHRRLSPYELWIDRTKADKNKVKDEPGIAQNNNDEGRGAKDSMNESQSHSNNVVEMETDSKTVDQDSSTDTINHEDQASTEHDDVIAIPTPAQPDIVDQNDEFEDHERFRCHMCDNMSLRFKSYLKHVATHVDPPFRFKCAACTEDFAAPCSLRAHIDDKHANVLLMPYQCRRCLRRFKLKWSLASHLKYCEVAMERTKEIQSIKQLTKKLKSIGADGVDGGMYSCPICTVTFDTPKELQTHLYYHDETKPYKCDQCTRGFTSKRAMEKHQVMHEPKDDCFCKLCGVQLLTKSGYNAHLRGHRNQEMLQAQTAMYLGKEKPELNRETASELLRKIKVEPKMRKEGEPAPQPIISRGRKYECPLCEAKFFSGGEKFQAHVRKMHTEAVFEQCKLCKKKYYGKENMERHIKLHSMFAETFPCEVCGKKFKRKHALDIHRKLHTFRKFVSCDICGQEFRFVSEVDKHKHVKHRYDRVMNIFKCGVCGQKFPMLSHLAVHCHHHNLVDAKPFECDLCQVMYSTSTELKQHIFQAHEDLIKAANEEATNTDDEANSKAFDGTVIKDEPMDVGYTPESNSGTKSKKTPTSSKSKSGPKTPALKEENLLDDASTPINVDAYNWATIQSTIQAKFLKRHVCEICSKAFASNSDLKTHRRTHSGETPFKCDYCDRSFKQRGHRKLHIQVVHTKEMPYKCDQCDAAFPTRYRHQIHLKRHTGVRDFSCEVCKKEFYTFGKMNEHRKKRHGWGSDWVDTPLDASALVDDQEEEEAEDQGDMEEDQGENEEDQMENEEDQGENEEDQGENYEQEEMEEEVNHYGGGGEGDNEEGQAENVVKKREVVKEEVEEQEVSKKKRRKRKR